MTEEPQRLSKVVAALVPCSRREAEQYIAEGWVRVDGQVVDQPQFRVANERVEIDREARLQESAPATMLVHKPAGFDAGRLPDLLDAASHWAGDESGIRRIRSHAVGLSSMLELPTPASGLCVLSQDGRVLRKLHDDADSLEQELVAEVTGTVAPDGLGRIARGLVFEGRTLPPLRVSWQSEQRLRFAVKGQAAHRIPWMCAQVGLQLTALKRIRIGRVPMAALPPGQWRYLAAHERF